MHEVFSLLCAIFGFQVGISVLKIRRELQIIKNRLQKSPAPSVVSTPTVPRPREESSFIAEPKSPQQIEFEETEELRKLNPGKF